MTSKCAHCGARERVETGKGTVCAYCDTVIVRRPAPVAVLHPGARVREFFTGPKVTIDVEPPLPRVFVSTVKK